MTKLELRTCHSPRLDVTRKNLVRRRINGNVAARLGLRSTCTTLVDNGGGLDLVIGLVRSDLRKNDRGAGVNHSTAGARKKTGSVSDCTPKSVSASMVSATWLLSLIPMPITYQTLRLARGAQ